MYFQSLDCVLMPTAFKTLFRIKHCSQHVVIIVAVLMLEHGTRVLCLWFSRAQLQTDDRSHRLPLWCLYAAVSEPMREKYFGTYKTEVLVDHV